MDELDLYVLRDDYDATKWFRRLSFCVVLVPVQPDHLGLYGCTDRVWVRCLQRLVFQEHVDFIYRNVFSIRLGCLLFQEQS